MRLHPLLALCRLVLIMALPCAAFGATDAEYAALTRKIFDRIGALKSSTPAVDWAKEAKRAVVHPDGSGEFSIYHNVEWVLDYPGQQASKGNARHPVYGPGGFWIHLTFYRGAWGGAAMFASIDFDDLHLWFSNGYKDDTTAIGMVYRIVKEERSAFAQAHPHQARSVLPPPETLVAELKH